MSAADADNPWPGLATFTEDQAGLFHGRDAEIRDLTKRAERNPLTVLFGQSGLGKSSLLQAGVFPRLRASNYWPIYVRLDHGPGAPTPTEQIKALVQADTARAGTWTKPGSAQPGESLWEFFHHRDDKLIGANGRTIIPVLVFDQFEELFTLGAGAARSAGSAGSASSPQASSPQASSGSASAEDGRARAVAFMSELAELVENRPSEKLVARLEESSAEMEVFDFSRTDYRVVITLREDYLPHLESLKTIMPALMENRMRLARMTGTQALEAVVKPGGALVTEDVARAIVEFVAGAKGGSIERLAELGVEPPLLSVICRELNERRRALGQTQITVDLVSGNRREILTDFYERSVADLPADMRAFVEDHLLTKSGFRDNLALETALEFPGVTQPLIDTLVSRRLLRLEDRLGVQRVELTHDVLAEVIRGSRDTRQQRLALEQTRQRERITRRRMWLARTIAAGLLVGLTGVSWIAWRAIRAEGEQTRLRADAEQLRTAADALRVKAEADELAALRKAYASDMNGVQAALAADNLGRARALLDRHRPAPGEVDLRGWEWRYLWQFCRSDATAILKEPNDNSIISLAVSSDRQWLATGGLFAGERFVFNLATKEKIKVPAGAGNVRVAFSPQAPLLAIGSDDRERGFSTLSSPTSRVLLWDATTRKIVREISLAGACDGIAFSSDARMLATVEIGRERIISLWRVADGAQVGSWTGGSGSNPIVTSFATTPDLNYAAFPLFRDSSGNRGVRVIDLKSGQERSVIVTDSISGGLALSPDGAKLATTPMGMAEGSAIQLWDVATSREIGRLDGHRGRVGQMIFLPDGKHLISASADQTLRLWDLGTGTVVRTFRGHKTEVWTVQLMSDQRTVVSGSKDGSVYRWDLQAGQETPAAWTVERGSGGAWAFAAGGEFIVNVDVAGRVTRRQGRTFQEEKPLLDVGPLWAGGRAWLNAPVFDRRRPLLAIATDDGKVQVWDWKRGQLVREFPKVDGSQQAVPQQFTRDGAGLGVRLGSGSEIFAYREWEITTGRETHSFDFTLTPSTRFFPAFSPDGTKMACLGYPSGEGQLFDLQTGRTTPFKLNMWEPGPHLGFSPDGRLLGVPSLQSSLRIVDVTAVREVAALGGYMFGVHAAAISPDGQRFVSGGTGVEALALWDAQSHERLLTLAAKTSALSPVEFSPDGNVLLGANRTGAGTTVPSTLYFWRAPTWAEIEQAEAAERAGAKP